MGWGTHPDTITMSMASTQAIEATGESDSLQYLEAYLIAYEQMAAGQNGADQYFQKLDKQISDWKEHGRDLTLNYDAPMMGFIEPKEVEISGDTNQENNPFAHGDPAEFAKLIASLFPQNKGLVK